MKRRLRILVALLLGLFVSTGVSAGDVEIEVSRFPFGNRVPNGSWTPLLTRVVNRSGQTREVAVATSFPVGGQGQEEVVFSRHLRMPPHSRRTVESFVLLDYPPLALSHLFDHNEETIEYPDGAKRTLLRRKAKPFHFRSRLVDTRTGDVLHEYEFPSLPFHPADVVIGQVDGPRPLRQTAERYVEDGLTFVLGEHASDAGFLSPTDPPRSEAFGRSLLPSEDELGGLAQPVLIQAPDLPGKWAAYEGVRVLVLGSLASSAGERGLSPQQRHSLLRYVRAGGRLVVMPSHEPEAYEHPFWRQLLPVRLMGRRPPAQDLTALEQRFGGKIAFDADLPPLLTDALPGEGEVLLENDGRVFLARRAVGGGEVWFVAVPGGAFGDWSRGHEFMVQMLKPPADAVPGLRSILPGHARTLLGHLVGVEAPGRGLIVALLGGYVALAAVALLVTRMRGRAELGWALVLVLAVVFAGIGVVLDQANSSRVGFVSGEIGVTVLGSGDANGSSVGFVGMLSPRQIETDLPWSQADTLASLASSWDDPGAPARALRVRQTHRFTFDQVRLNRMEMLPCRTMTLVRYGEGVEVAAGFGADGLHGRVVNRTGRPLEDCLVRIGRRALHLGRLEVGQEVDLAKVELSWDLTPPTLGSDAEDRVRLWTLGGLLNEPRSDFGSHSIETSPIAFYGWTDAAQAMVDEVDGVQPKHRALQLLVVPLRHLEAGPRVRLPAGMCGLRVLRGTGQGGYGAPAGPLPSYDQIRLPELTRIAGMGGRQQRGGKASKNDKPTPGAGLPNASANDGMTKPLALEDLLALPSWQSSAGAGMLRVQFALPEGLPALKLEKATLTLDVDMRELSGRIRARRGEGSDWVNLPLKPGEGRAELDLLPKHAKLFGPAGEMPELELSLRPGVDTDITRSWWRIREFEMAVEGRVLESGRDD